MMGGDLDKLFKLQSRLRNVANANADVNFTRAAISGSVKLRSDREADFRSLEAAAPEVTMAASPRERVRPPDSFPREPLRPGQGRGTSAKNDMGVEAAAN